MILSLKKKTAVLAFVLKEYETAGGSIDSYINQKDSNGQSALDYTSLKSVKWNKKMRCLLERTEKIYQAHG